MTGKIYHPENKHPEPYQEDLAPNASKGLNYGLAGPPMPMRNAVDIKELHVLLQDFADDELRQMRVLGDGARLETGATYLMLDGDQFVEIKAEGDEDVEPNELYLPKKEMPYELWNRLLERDHPGRTKQAPK